MTNEQLAYMAGVFDGEGCIFIGRGRGTDYALTCVLEMTDGRVPRIFESAFGGSGRVCAPRGLRKPLYRWTITVRGARQFLETIRPFLITKETEAWLALEFLAQRTISTGTRITDEEIALREGFYWALRNAKNLQVV